MLYHRGDLQSCRCSYPFTGISCEEIDSCQDVDCVHGTCHQAFIGELHIVAVLRCSKQSLTSMNEHVFSRDFFSVSVPACHFGSIITTIFLPFSGLRCVVHTFVQRVDVTSGWLWSEQLLVPGRSGLDRAVGADHLQLGDGDYAVWSQWYVASLCSV